MTLNESLKEAYFSLEDKWYSFIDNIASKVPAIGQAVDGIEEKGIPTFPLAIAVILMLVILLLAIFTSSGSALSITVLDKNGEGVVGAEVSVFLDDNIKGAEKTDEKGKVVFFLPNNEYELQIMKDNYNTLNKHGITPGEKEFILDPEQSSLTKAIALKTSNGETISSSGQVRYYCDGEEKIENYSNGIFNAKFDECEEITVDSISGYNILIGRASLSGIGEVIVEESEQKTGTITVSLEGENVSGVKVTLNSVDGSVTKTKSANTNTVIFSEVPTESYYITTHDPNGNFEDYSGQAEGEVKELTEEETESFNIILNESISSQITINVRGEKGPIKGAEVILSTTDKEEVSTEITGETGQIIFNVPAETDYIVSAEHPDYIIGSPISVSSGETKDMFLVEATEENSQSLLVKVKDSLGEPINNVKVTLKRLNDDTKVGEKATGAKGEIEFFNLEIGSYYAYAIKSGFEGTTSISVQVAPRRQSNLDITLDIGHGDIDLEILNDTSQLIMGANVKAVNLISDKIEEEKVTNAEGIAEFSIRQDKKIYFVVESGDYLDYYTSSIIPDKGATIEKTIKMQKGTGSLRAMIKGVYLGESEVNRTISQGQYNVIGLMEIPQGNFNEAGFHIRTGKAEEGRTNLMEEDTYKLGQVMSSADKTRKGTTYTPSKGYNIDVKNLTNGNAKWAEAIWKQPKEGIYEIDSDLLVENVQANTTVNIWYRGWAKGSSTLRDPTDGTGQELYLDAKNYILTGGTSNLCTEGFCKSNSIKILSGKKAGRVQYINDKFTATEDNTYKLMSEITNLNNIGNAVLEIKSSGIQLNEVKINGQKIEDTMTLGNLSPNMFTQIEADFETVKSGAGTIKINIKSNNEIVYEHTITINVQANKKFNLEIIPKQLIPYIDNTMFFEIKDNNVPVDNALIEISVNNEILDTVETNIEGLAEYNLTEPTPGDMVKIVANKEGYDEIEVEKEVDERLLIISPPEISEIIKIGEAAFLEHQITIQNGTVEDLTITRMEVGGELEDYLVVTTTDQIDGQKIESNEKVKKTLKFKPTAIANRLESPLNVEGTIRLDTRISGQTFSTDIPVTIRLSMPGYLDSEKCLKASNTKLEFNTSVQEQTKTIQLRNNCTAEGIKVNLHNIRAKLNEESKFGNISFTGDVTGTNINTSETEIKDIIEKDSEITVEIKFRPNVSIDSGKQTIDIIFEADNIPAEGEKEKIEEEVKTEIVMSNLSECLEIDKPADGVIIELAGWNLGYNRIQQSSLASRTSGYQGITQRYPFNMQQQLPFTSQAYQPQMQQYEKNSFVIKNNCASEVEIDLDPDSRVSVSEEKFTIPADNDETVTISSGYTLGKYDVEVNAKVVGDIKKQKIGNVPVTIRKLGELDSDCIEVNVSKLSFNSFLYKSKKYKVYNNCYNSGISLARDNRAVTIQCDAPQLQNNQGPGYFQMGAEPTYRDNYPIGGTYNSYHEYLEPQGCSGNACSLITGTRVHNVAVLGEGTEELTFEVMPSAKYMPQRKLFDNKTQQYGLFQSLGSIRQWGTETNARTGVYGNINVQYSNQYGSSECLSFPIEIEDDWRMLESIDSAINWGDPNARPEECVGNLQKKEALNIKSKWGDGAIPDTEYNKKGKYLYIPEPRAVQVGPAPRTNIYPSPAYSRYNFRRGEERKQKGDAKNCGLMDSLKELNYEKKHGGVIVTIEPSSTGSYINNTRGPNLLVEIDRSNIQHNCVNINMPVTAKLSRAKTLESGEVKWNFKAIVTKPGYNYQGNPNECYNIGIGEIDCVELLKSEGSYDKLVTNYPKCEQEMTPERAEEILEESTIDAKGCSTNYEEYGFEKIGETNAENVEGNELDNYCENNFCNGDLLSLYIKDKLIKISEKSGDEGGNIIITGDSEGMISKLYMEAYKTEFSDNNYYYDESNKKLVDARLDLDEFLTEKHKEVIINLDNNKSQFVSVFNTVINEIKNESELDEEVAVRVNIIKATNPLKNDIGNLDDKNFNTANYIYLGLDELKEYINNFLNNNSNLELIKHLATNTEIVKIIKEDGEERPRERELIYDAYDDLKEIHELANKDKVYLTSQIRLVNNEYIDGCNIGLNCINSTLVNDTEKFNLEASCGNAECIGLESLPGEYNLAIDYNLMETGEEYIDVEITGERKDNQEYENAKENILLKKGFDFDSKEETGDPVNTLVKNNALYKVVPVEIIATLYAQEEYLAYKHLSEQKESINWYSGNQKISEAKYSGFNALEKNTTSGAKTYKGIYYAPGDVSLIFNTSGKLVEGASVKAKGIDLGGRLTENATKSSSVNNLNANADDISLSSLRTPDLDGVVRLVKERKACISTNGTTITYNEEQLLK